MPQEIPHIVLVGGDGHPSGVPRHITDLAQALQGQARITVISEPDRGGYGALAALGAQHIPLTGLSSRLDPRHWRRGRAALADCLNRLSPALVWAHARMPVLALRQMMLAGQWCPAPGTKLALTYHGLPFGRGHRPGTSTLARTMERRLLTACAPLDLVFLTTAQNARMATAMGGAMAAHRTHVLGNASHLGPCPGPPAERPSGRHIVMTGRAGWQKNYAAALRLMRHLPGDITLSLCGAGTDTPRFDRQVQRLAGPAADRVRALGPLEDVRPLLASGDAYMLTSRYEGQPIGALEASEYGLPLILSDFEEAASLARGHPAALRLTGPLPAQAGAIDALLTQALAERDRFAADIRAFWEAHHAPARFVQEARALVGVMLRK